MNSHERNQVYQQLLRPGAPPAETFLRKATSAVRRIHIYNWFALGFFALCLTAAWVWR